MRLTGRHAIIGKEATVDKGSLNSPSRKARVLLADVRFVHSCGNAAEHQAHRNASSSNARLAVHDCRINRDQVKKLECHALIIAIL